MGVAVLVASVTGNCDGYKEGDGIVELETVDKMFRINGWKI